MNLLGHALHLDAVEKASMIYSNAGNLIIPIVTAVLGKEWVIYSSAFLSVQLFLLWSHAKSMLCGEKSFELKKVLTNINMIAILAGAALFLLHIQLPAIIEDSLDMVGSAIGPISMIILGMLMAGMNFKKILATVGCGWSRPCGWWASRWQLWPCSSSAAWPIWCRTARPSCW